jgi:hypothetical protein
MVFARRSSWWAWLAAVATAGAALVWSNPGPAEFEAFAGDRLVDLASGELCGSQGLPMAIQLLVRDCPQLVRSQRAVLGALASRGTRRFNLGLFSLYVTEVGGQALLPGLRVPHYRTLTLAGAGQLLLLASSDSQELGR